MVKACWCFGAKTERIFAAAAIATASCLKSTAGETACASAKLAQPADLQLSETPIRLRRHGRPSLLEAVPAKHRSSLRWSEWNRGVLAALRTDGAGFSSR